MVHRVAIYFTPPPGDLLASTAAEWLGRDPYGRPIVAGVDATSDRPVEAPRRYGFHATLKAPFRLAANETVSDVDEALCRFCDANTAVSIPSLQLARLDGFLALVPAAMVPDLHRLADRVVELFDRHRAPLTEGELARREVSRLTESERASLMRWGYPFTHTNFKFHMTLTGPVPIDEIAAVESRLAERFGPFIDQPLAIDGLALFVEPEQGAEFLVHSRYPLKGTDQ